MNWPGSAERGLTRKAWARLEKNGAATIFSPINGGRRAHQGIGGGLVSRKPSAPTGFPNHETLIGARRLGGRRSENIRQISVSQRDAAFVGGRWIGADKGMTILVINPAMGETLGAVPDCGHDRFVEKLVAAVTTFKVGNEGEGVERRPLMDSYAVERVEEHIADAMGATVVAGGKRHALGGAFFEPTVLTGIAKKAKLAREETFGPTAPVFRFDAEEHAVEMANATEFGLASNFRTRDLARAFRVADALKCGMVGINEGLITTEVAPFGGVKESGMGREGSKYGVDDYLDVKCVCLGGWTAEPAKPYLTAAPIALRRQKPSAPAPRRSKPGRISDGR